MTIWEQFIEFLDSNKRNAWLDVDEWKVYVRKTSYRRFNDQLYVCLDIASVDVLPEYQNTGLFSGFLDEIISKYRFNIFVENIGNPVLLELLLRRGFCVIHDPFAPSAILIKHTYEPT